MINSQNSSQNIIFIFSIVVLIFLNVIAFGSDNDKYITETPDINTQTAEIPKKQNDSYIQNDDLMVMKYKNSHDVRRSLPNPCFPIFEKDRIIDPQPFRPPPKGRPGTPVPVNPFGPEQLVCLPNFLIIGIMKSGTTFLNDYLQKSPEIVKQKLKEVYFFNRKDNWQRGIGWYSDNWIDFDPYTQQKLIGEATPSYFHSKDVPERIYQMIPKTKLILSFRNPTDRALSQYNHAIQNKGDSHLKKVSFEEALDQEIQVIKSCFQDFSVGNVKLDLEISFSGKSVEVTLPYYQRCQEDCSVCFSNTIPDPVHPPQSAGFGLLLKSFYEFNLVRWLKFFPKEQFLFLDFNDIENQPQKVLDLMFDFLDIKRINFDNLKPKNDIDYPEISQETKKKLDSFFFKLNEQFFKTLGQDLGWNKK